jgi:pimeloyl-ACP methyl ester carboxylesterase
MRRPLATSELFPAGDRDISVRMLKLSTGVNVRVAESGPPTGKPLVMIYGWGGSLYMFRHGLRLLPPLGIRAISVDLRGYGLSDKPRVRGAYTLDVYIADLDALLDALELPRAALMGQSMGGAVALRYALRRPERVTRLVLINPAALVPIVYPALLGAAPRGLARLVRERFIPRSLIALIMRRLAYADASRVTDRDIDEYWAPARLPGYVHAANAALHEFDWRPLTPGEAASLAVPTLVMLGKRDRLIRKARTNAERLRGSRVYEMEGGHLINEEHPDEFYRVVGEFVR